jgi:hypothetical protein
LVESKLKPPAANLLSQDNRAACTIVHTVESTQEFRLCPEVICTIVHS